MELVAVRPRTLSSIDLDYAKVQRLMIHFEGDGLLFLGHRSLDQYFINRSYPKLDWSEKTGQVTRSYRDEWMASCNVHFAPIDCRANCGGNFRYI